MGRPGPATYRREAGGSDHRQTQAVSHGNAVLERADSEAAEGLGAGSPGRVLVLMGMMSSEQVSAHMGEMKGDGALRP